MRVQVLVVFMALALAPAPALAAHLTNYINNPVEHDDQGRSDEPDGVSLAGVFGTTLQNVVVDLDLDGYADVPIPSGLPGKRAVLAPGCTDDAGVRAQSGQCGMSSLGYVPDGLPPAVIAEGNCPGRYGGQPVRFFDVRADLGVYSPGSAFASQHPVLFDVNHKVTDADTTTGGLLRNVGVQPALVGPTTFWAWYGLWEDLNCNGVIDHLQLNAGDPAVADPDNEFTWYGRCFDAGDAGPNPDIPPAFNTDAVNGKYCAEDPNPNSDPPGEAGGAANTNMTGYVYPGFSPDSDMPNGLVPDINLLNPNIGDGYIIPPIRTAAATAPDFYGTDSTGFDDQDARMWLMGQGPPSWFYDQSIFVTTYVVGGVNCRPDPSLEARFQLGATGGPGSACTFLDVDVFRPVTPILEQLVKGVKDLFTGTYTQVADLINGVYNDQGPISRLLGQLTGRTFNDATLGPQVGMVKQLVQDPGWAREPNVGPTALPGGAVVEDLYLDVRHGSGCHGNENLSMEEEEFRGWCNYAPSDPDGFQAYAAYQGTEFRGWMDVKPQKVLFWVPAVTPFPGDDPILPGVSNDWPFTDYDPLPPGKAPASPDEHSRTLDAGQWYFFGIIGRWRDQVQVADESVFPQTSAETRCTEDPSQSQCETYGKDRWIGFLSGGVQVYQGYYPEVCTTEEGPGLHQWAQCNPYFDGNVFDPQTYGNAPNDEWQDGNDLDGSDRPACQLTGSEVLTIYPRDGTWSIPVLVIRNINQNVAVVGPLPDVEQVTPGETAPIVLRTKVTGDQNPCENHLNFGVVMTTKDQIILPVGNMGEDLITVFTAAVPITLEGVPTFDVITDVDLYASALIEPL